MCVTACVSRWIYVHVCVWMLCVSLCLWALLSLCVSLWLLRHVCFHVPWFVFLCAFVYVCMLEITARGWVPEEWRQRICRKTQGENEKSAVTGGSWGPGDSVRPRESHDIFVRTLQLLWGLECGWGWQVRSVLSRDFRQQDDLPPNQHLACRVLSPFCSWEHQVSPLTLSWHWRASRGLWGAHPGLETLESPREESVPPSVLLLKRSLAGSPLTPRQHLVIFLWSTFFPLLINQWVPRTSQPH